MGITPSGRVLLCGLNGALLSASAALSEREKGKERDKGSGAHAHAHSQSHSQSQSQSPTAASLPSLVTTAPEVVLGGCASAESSVWAAGAVCVHIITGKPLIKVGSGVECRYWVGGGVEWGLLAG